LPNDLKKAFAMEKITPVARPEVKLSGFPNPYWFTGFVDGDGCF
jgi:hypothetical protein